MPREVLPLAEAVKNRIYVEDPQWAFAQVLALIEKELLN